MLGATQTDTTDRCVLQGLPRVGFYDGNGAPEDDLLPSCIKSFLRYRGEDLGFLSRPYAADPWHDLHCYLLGLSGCAFRRIMTPDAWDMGDGSPFRMTDDPIEPARRALAGAGYGCDALLKSGFAAEYRLSLPAEASEEEWRARIVESIREKGRPVIAVGVIGPPEPCLITGYDEGGEVLIGWNAFQTDAEFADGMEYEPDGTFRKRGWFAGTEALILIGDPQPRPDAVALHRSALALGVRLLRGPYARERLSGQAAFSAWAEQLLDDRNFAGLPAEELMHRMYVHHQRGGDLAEARAFGAPFLRFLAEAHPEARAELLAAARCFDDEHDLVWAIWEFTSGMVADQAGAEKLARPDVRGRIVPLIRLARTRDAEAADHLERAIRQMDEASWAARHASLAPNPPARVVREGGWTEIAGLPDLEWGASRNCTFIGSVEALTSVTERPLRYADMMGATGIAFRLRWSNPDTLGGWDMACPCGEFMEEWEDLQRAMGIELEAEFPGVGEDAATDANAQRVVQHIEAGRPVMACVDGPDIGLIVGYADGGRTMRVHRYGTAGAYDISAQAACGGFQLHWAGFTQAPPPISAFVGGLRTAARNWRRGKAHAGYAVHGHEWYYGRRAFEVWMDDLTVRDHASLSEGDVARLYGMNRWVWMCLIDARRAAVTYLRDHAHLLGVEAAGPALAAAAAYQREVDLLSGATDLPCMDPCSQPPSAWGPDQRRRQRELLQEAMETEAEAIQQMEQAAAAHEAVPPAMREGETSHFALLRGVPRVGYDVNLCPFPGSLHAALRYLGDETSLEAIAAVTGAAFRRFWQRDDGGNVDLMYLGHEPIRRAEALARRDLTIVPPADRGAMVAALKESIGHGRPLVAFGIIGPPEAGLVTGYDRSGDVLYGWSYFQDRSSPGYYQRTEWHEQAAWAGDVGFVTIGDKRRWPGPSSRSILLDTLKWAINLARTPVRPERPEHLSGLAATDAWADALEVDADYRADDAEVMERRVMVHGDQCCMLEDRRLGARWLREMASVAPEAADYLTAAADLLDRAAGAGVWPWGSDRCDHAREGLADPELRRTIAGQVREARRNEADAVERIEAAVRAMEAG
jgi:hypothetical protein